MDRMGFGEVEGWLIGFGEGEAGWVEDHGWMVFAMLDHLVGLVKVRVLKGVNLAIRDLRSSDPYVVARIGKQKLKTRVVKKSINPEWNEELTLSIEDPAVLLDCFVAMDSIGFYTGILNGENIPGLDDMNFPLTPHNQNNTIDTPSELQDDLVEVSVTEVAASRRAAKGTSHRTKKFDPEEDKVICSAWLNVSKDPIHGASQNKVSFWGRIRAYFEEHKKTEAVRSENSIMHRWLTIQREVNKFCSVYEKIVGRNASGATIQDMITQATEMYGGVDEEKKSFTLLHCWNILKDEEKWKTRRIEMAEQEKLTNKKKGKRAMDSTSINVDANLNEEVHDFAAQNSQEKRKRPPGQKEAKEARKRGGTDTYIEALDKMLEKKEARDKERDKAREASLEIEKASLEIEKAALELEKKRLSNEEKKIEADMMKEEKDIMLADTSSLDQDQLQWIQIMKKKILARHMSN